MGQQGPVELSRQSEKGADNCSDECLYTCFQVEEGINVTEGKKPSYKSIYMCSANHVSTYIALLPIFWQRYK